MAGLATPGGKILYGRKKEFAVQEGRRMVGRACRLIVATALVALGCFPGSAWAERPLLEREGIPPVVFVQLPLRSLDHPMFVSASVAITDDGELNTDLFAPDVARIINRYYERHDPVRGCITLDEFYEEWAGSADRSTIEKAAQTAELVLVAEVVGRDYGFQHMIPGQLLRVRPERVLKGTAPLAHYLVFLPVGTFQSGPYRFCKTDSRYPEPPEIGERVLLLVPVGGDPQEPYLDLRTEASIVTVDAGGKVDLPQPFARSLQQEQPLTIEAVLDRIAATVGRGEEK